MLRHDKPSFSWLVCYYTSFASATNPNTLLLAFMAIVYPPNTRVKGRSGGALGELPSVLAEQRI
jgi:hypothetical protein